MADEVKRCAHALCSCLAAEGSKYCSLSCEDSAETTTIACDCGHVGCTGAA